MSGIGGKVGLGADNDSPIVAVAVNGAAGSGVDPGRYVIVGVDMLAIGVPRASESRSRRVGLLVAVGDFTSSTVIEVGSGTVELAPSRDIDVFAGDCVAVACNPPLA